MIFAILGNLQDVWGVLVHFFQKSIPGGKIYDHGDSTLWKDGKS